MNGQTLFQWVMARFTFVHCLDGHPRCSSDCILIKYTKHRDSLLNMGYLQLIINMTGLWITNIAFEIYVSYILRKNTVSNVCWNVSNEISLICQLFLLDSNEIKWSATEFCLCLAASRLLCWVSEETSTASQTMPRFGKIFQYELNFFVIKFLPDQMIWAMLSTFIDSAVCVFFVFLPIFESQIRQWVNTELN